MRTQIDISEKHLRTQLHAIKARLRMSDDEYRAMLHDTYKVESSTELNAHQLIDLIHTLQQHLPQDSELEKARRRCAASIMAWFRATGYHPENMTKAVRSTACRAAQSVRWEQIGIERLRAIGMAFSKKAKTYEHALVVAGEGEAGGSAAADKDVSNGVQTVIKRLSPVSV